MKNSKIYRRKFYSEYAWKIQMTVKASFVELQFFFFNKKICKEKIGEKKINKT